MLLLTPTVQRELYATKCSALNPMGKICKGQVYNVTPPPVTAPCGAIVSGGQTGPFPGDDHVAYYALGDVAGTVTVTMVFPALPGQSAAIYYDNVLVGSWSALGGTHSRTFDYTPTPGRPRYYKVVVFETPAVASTWQYSAGCPS